MSDAMSMIVCSAPGDVRSICRSGPEHESLGVFLDAGSFGLLDDDGAGIQDVFGSGLDRAAESADIRLLKQDWPTHGAGNGEAQPQSGLVVWESSQYLDSLGPDMAQTSYAHLAAGDAISIVIRDRAARESLLWIICGYHLPSMGPVARAKREDLWATWLRLAGATRTTGRFLLEEEADAVDPGGEQDLTKRLRELYGD